MLSIADLGFKKSSDSLFSLCCARFPTLRLASGVSPKAFHEKHTNRKVGFFVKKYKITFFERSSTLRFLRFLQEALGETEGANRKVGIVLRVSEPLISPR